MLRPHSRQGFTLIELMIVVGIIAILASLSIWQISKGNASARMVEIAGDLQGSLLKARTGAVNDQAFHKVCAFRDGSPYDATAAGRVLRFKCFTPGSSGCPTGTICNSVNDSGSATLFDTALFASAQATCAAGTWCQVTDGSFDVARSPYVRHGVSIRGFDASANASEAALGTSTTGRLALEVTYGPTGTVNIPRSSLPSAALYVTHFHHCLPGIPPGGTCSGFAKRGVVRYVLGGSARFN